MLQYLDRQSAILLAVFPSIALGLLNTYWTEPLHNFSPTLFWAVDISQWLLVPFLVWLLVLRPNKITLAEIGFRSPQNHRKLLESFGGEEFALALFVLAFVYFFVDRVATALVWAHLGLEPGFGYGAVAQSSDHYRYVAALYFGITAAVIEEVVFRGLPWLYLSKNGAGGARKVVYVVITATVFAVTHSEQGLAGVISSGFFGVAAALIFLRTRNLYPVVASHFVIDVVSFWSK